MIYEYNKFCEIYSAASWCARLTWRNLERAFWCAATWCACVVARHPGARVVLRGILVRALVLLLVELPDGIVDGTGELHDGSLPPRLHHHRGVHRTNTATIK